MTQLHRVFCFATSVAFTLLVLPSMSRAGTWVAFQSSYTRGTGAPVTVTNTFTLLNPATQYTLKAFNGGLQNDTSELVSYSVVYLNGAQVVGPANFNQNVAEVNVTILPAFTNTLSVQVRGKPGGVLTIQVIGVDNDPPTITASVSPSPNAAGWNNSPVTITFTCSDKTSGVGSCPSPITVNTEGANQVIPGTATDLAGNTASTSVTINLDMTPPTITGSINPPPDAGGYNGGPVTVTFNCADALSGVASCSLAVSVTSEGTTPETGTAVDVAGNTASVTITVNISLSYFKIQSWQTGPNGNAHSPSGKCLDYGTSPSGNGATVFLNDCASANSIRILEIGPTPPNSPPGTPCVSPRTGSGGTLLCHEVMLFAGNGVIGVYNPLTISPGGTTSSPQPVTEYQLAVQAPFFSPRGGALFTPAQQIWRLDGDGIILEDSSVDPATNAPVPGPCINTTSTPWPICPAPPPQLVIQVENARGVNGSPLVAAVRNLSDNEFWDFVPAPGSRPYPTTGFQSTVNSLPITSADTLSSAVSNATWGSVILVSSPTDCMVTDPFAPGTPQDIGGCINLSNYPALVLNAGETIRGNRRGTNFGPQLYAAYSGTSSADCDGTCMIDIAGDYVRITGLRLRGQRRSTSTVLDALSHNDGIRIDYAGTFPLPAPLVPTPSWENSTLATITQFIATIDHNDMSDWSDAAVTVSAPFTNDSNFSIGCIYIGFSDSNGNALDYPCGSSFPSAPNVPFPPAFGLPLVPIAEDPINPPGAGTLANTRVSHNFLHHNEAGERGYGVGVQGRAFIDGNTFSWNRHDISANGDPHYEYRASHNLVLSGAPIYGLFSGRLQDFDMHGTDLADDACCGQSSLYFGGVGGYYVEIDGNTFLGGDGHDYVLRGYPVVNSYYHHNVSRRKENDAIHFIHCFDLGCVNDYNASDFPITISNSVFGQTGSSPPDPMSTLGVGDFDGDGDDDLFVATGNTWLYSPGGQREWRYLNSAPDTIGQLLFGDFDGDGRTDVVALRNGQLVVSWGGISAFEVLNYGPLPCSSMPDMAVGDFDGDGKPDIFCADGQTWWISYGGNTPFVQVIVSSFLHVQDLRFGDFDGNGTTDVFGVTTGPCTTPCWAVRYGPKGYQGLLGGWQPLQASLTSNPASVDGLVVADFDGNGFADVGMACTNFGAPGWQISYGGAQGWSNCNTFAGSFNAVNCALSISPCVTLANGAVGHFSGGAAADILLWYYTNSQGAAAPLFDMPGGTGTPYVLSSQDMH